MVVAAEPTTVKSQPSAVAGEKIYSLFWRRQASHPWHSQEYDNRHDAHQRYFQLLELGCEVYLERRQSLRSE